MVSPRPNLSVPLSLPLEVLALAGIVAGLVVTLYAVCVLPDTIPIHFGLDGRPNGWGSKHSLWQFLGIAVFLYLMLSVLRRFPSIFNYPVAITPENAARQYQLACQMLDWLKAEMTWLFAYIDWQIYQLATTSGLGLGPVFLGITILGIGGTIGVYLWQALQAR